MRLLALTGVLLVALVGAGSAQAEITPPEFNPSADDQFWEIVNEDFNPLSPEAQDALDRLPDMTPEERDEYLEKWKEGDADAKMRSRRWPRLGAFVGTIAVSIAATLGLEYALKMEIPGQGFIYKLITGEEYAGTSTGLSNVRWRIVCDVTNPTLCPSSGGGSITGGPNPSYTDFASGRGWVLMATLSGVGTRWLTCDPLLATNCDDDGVEWIFGTLAHSLTAFTVKKLATATPNGCGSSVATTDCTAIYRTEDEMEAAVSIRDSDATEYAAATNKGDAGTYTPPTATTDDKEAAWSYGDTTNVSNEWRDYIYIRMNPELNYSGSFVLPQPQPNETYSAYITRLQNLGWYGDATTTERGEEHPDYGPNSPVRITAPDVGTGTVRILDPIRWPSQQPTVLKSEDITILYNPATAETVAEGTGSTPITVPPTTIPGTPALDFTPITNLDPGCKFPYGFVCYAVDFTEQFDVGADAPVFTFTLGWTGMVNGQSEGGEAPYTVDLEVMDDYMALWRGILTVVLWVGAIYLVATRMLGVKFGGDPGEAIDDVL